MKNIPVWRLQSDPPGFPCADRDMHADIAIIGGGITGITLAYHLRQSGAKVVVLEARKVGKGTTGQSTGNLYIPVEYSFQELRKKYEIDTLQKVFQSRREALNLIEQIAGEFTIDCDFGKKSMYLFESGNSISLGKEAAIARELKLNLSSIEFPGFPLPYDSGIEFPDQAQFNPLTYVETLARRIQGEGCEIFEDSRVFKIEEKDGAIFLHTKKSVVQARQVVHATHTPIDLQIQYHTALGPYREYGIAAKLKGGTYPEGIFWGYYDEKKFSVRTFSPENDPYIIAVGSMHKVGQAENNKDHVRELKSFLKRYFDIEKFTHQWGGQNYKPADLLPYIGRLKQGSEQFVATGFSADGLVYGTLAATILSDLILNRENSYRDLYKASRHRPLKAGKKVISENINVVKRLISDSLKSGIEMETKDLVPLEGKLLKMKEGNFAVYKSARGDIKILSPKCPHMGCTVQWNNLEKTWDCPCHGSRFDIDGRVIEGPSLHGLKKAEDSD